MRRPAILVAVLLAALAGLAGLALLTGAAPLADDGLRRTLLELRGVRAAAAALAGAGLAVAGVLVQGLFRNPLASPSVLGTTAGAALGGQLVLLCHAMLLAALPAWITPELLLPLGCLTGAGAALALLLVCAGRAPSLVALLLAGFLLATLFASVAAFLTSLGWQHWALGRAMAAFSLGGVDGKGVVHLALAAPLVGAGLLAAWGWGRHLDLMLTGPDEAASLGVDVPRLTRWLLVWVAVLTAGAVAVGGVVPFVCLVVPHALRGLIGPAHRALVPAAAVGGAVFTVACDLAARSLGEIPLGVITGLIGAPVFLLLLTRARRAGEL